MGTEDGNNFRQLTAEEESSLRRQMQPSPVITEYLLETGWSSYGPQAL